MVLLNNLKNKLNHIVQLTFTQREQLPSDLRVDLFFKAVFCNDSSKTTQSTNMLIYYHGRREALLVPQFYFVYICLLPFRQLWAVRSMHCHLPANHWLVGLHRVLSRNAERLVVAMVTLQVIKTLIFILQVHIS